MMICHCVGVTDRTIRQSVVEGASDLGSIADACGAGAVCGGCRPAVIDVMVSCGVSVVAVSLRSTVGRTPVSLARSLRASTAA